MSEAKHEAAGELHEQSTCVSVIQEAAELLVAWAERQGLKAHAVYFAVSCAPSPNGPQFPMCIGPMRYHFAEAKQDGAPYGAPVSFIVQFANPDSQASIAEFDRAMKEKAEGLCPGALSSYSSITLPPTGGRLH